MHQEKMTCLPVLLGATISYIGLHSNGRQVIFSWYAFEALLQLPSRQQPSRSMIVCVSLPLVLSCLRKYQRHQCPLARLCMLQPLCLHASLRPQSPPFIECLPASACSMQIPTCYPYGFSEELPLVASISINKVWQVPQSQCVHCWNLHWYTIARIDWQHCKWL